MAITNKQYAAFNGFTFADVFESVEVWLTEKDKWGFNFAELDNDAMSTIYYLLLANFAESHVRNYNEATFKLKVFSLVFQHGPTLVKKLDIQKKIRTLTAEQMKAGTKEVHNMAYGDERVPAEEVLDYINTQNTTKTNRGDAEAYAMQYALLKDDLITEFVDKFKSLFIKIAYPRNPILYETEVE